MPKKETKYTKDVHILITKKQKDYIDNIFEDTGFGKAIRYLINEAMNNDDFERQLLEIIRFQDEENGLISAIARKELFEEDQRTKEKEVLIQDVKAKILDMAKEHCWEIKDIPDGILLYGAGVCNISKTKFIEILNRP